MVEDTGPAILSATCFRLGLVGARLTQAFSDRIEHLGVTHKQVGLLAIVDAGLARSQRDIAEGLQVAPSLVVSLVDQLVGLGAVVRSRSASDRRVQVIELTESGRDLLAASAQVAAELDAEFRAALARPGQLALDTLLLDLEAQHPAIRAEAPGDRTDAGRRRLGR